MMDDVAVLILAATNQDAVWHETNKENRHLLRVGAERLLPRTLGQLAKLGYTATVVTEKPDIRALLPEHCFVPENHRWIVSTILSTRELWGDKTVVLFGDVIWDLYVLGLILGYGALPRFFGDGHIHAFAFLRENFDQIEGALKKTEQDFNENGGKCWPTHFYRAFCGKPIRDDAMNWEGGWSHWFTIRTTHTPNKSCVTDFDSMAIYQQWYQKHYGRDPEGDYNDH